MVLFDTFDLDFVRGDANDRSCSESGLRMASAVDSDTGESAGAKNK